ncbi:hypothetical protein IWW38_006138 [Coemansia aciculifera]|uniref:Uncharacterized protein n=1 Tax=Coemansia aciculifera TaxID=417176 RepID=A0ACC1LU51_9FUNG|nr:hypothetical protein IWW38_006138 [Coemansia aciculifera]
MTARGTPVDWFYVCPGHTSASSFCTSSVSAVASSDAVVAQAEQSSNAKDTDSKDSNKEAQSPEPALPPAPAPPVQYVLHKDYFYLRQRPHIKRWEQEQDKAFALNFPSAPRNVPK